jgi:hypothetical protein
MKKKDYTFVAVLLTVVLAASTAFALVSNVSAPYSNVDSQTAEDGDTSCTTAVYCDMAANSFMSCINPCTAKTGLEMLLEQVRSIN